MNAHYRIDDIARKGGIAERLRDAGHQQGGIGLECEPGVPGKPRLDSTASHEYDQAGTDQEPREDREHLE